MQFRLDEGLRVEFSTLDHTRRQVSETKFHKNSSQATKTFLQAKGTAHHSIGRQRRHECASFLPSYCHVCTLQSTPTAPATKTFAIYDVLRFQMHLNRWTRLGDRRPIKTRALGTFPIDALSLLMQWAQGNMRHVKIPEKKLFAFSS